MSEDTLAYNARQAAKMTGMNRQKQAEMDKRARWAADAEAERVANGYGAPPLNAPLMGSVSRSRARTRTRARSRTRSRARTRTRTRARARARTGGNRR
jgi:hypothetical protein